jgi:hypothetical protein
MQVPLKRAVSFFIIVLTMFLVSLPVDGLAKSKLKKCPTDIAPKRWNNCFGTYKGKRIKYVGEWRNGMSHGQGTFTSKGMKYVGGFRNDKMHGQGAYIFPDGRKTAGTWRNGKFVKKTR